MATWIKFSKAREELVEHLLKTSESDFLEAMKSAIRLILNALQDQAEPLPSRATDFALSFEALNDRQAWQLGENGAIPWLFWHHWCEAYERQNKRRDLLLINREDFATSFEHFEFRLSGMKDDGVMHGRAEGVELLRESLPGSMPLPRGRPAKPYYDDSEAIRFAAARLNAGEWYYDIAPIAIGMMKGLSEEGRRKRLILGLKEKGHSIPKRHEHP